MKRSDNPTLSAKEISELLAEYINAAQIHGGATGSGNSRAANQAYEQIAGIYRELRFRGSEAQNSLLSLLDHPDVAVRSWAASHSLEFAPNQGVPVLETLAAGQGVWGLESATTLKEWRKGTLTFP